MKIRKGDSVKILIGKDNGKTGAVEKVSTKKDWVFISGVNTYKRHVKGRKGVTGGIIDVIKPVKSSNVALICPHCQKPTRIGYKIDQNGKKRVCRKCQEVI